MKLKFLVTFLAIGLTNYVFSSIMQTNLPSKNGAIKISVAIHEDKQQLYCTITFKNISNKSEYLYKVISCYENKIDDDIFEINCSGQNISYTGRLVKRSSPQIGDFEELKSGQSIARTVRIDDKYNFSTKCNQYEIRYHAFLGSPQPGLPLQELMSEKVKFQFNKK